MPAFIQPSPLVPAKLRYQPLTLACLSALLTLPALALENEGRRDSEAKPEVITITGSRIRRTDLETHTPVVSISAEEIRLSGAVDVNQLLNQLPAMVPASGAETSNARGYAGTSTQDLRGMGAIRTLVLVNGRRHVPSIPGTSTVDVSSIPTALIERVDVLTGGASSVYGADAVSGVVNIILKQDFTGTQMNASYGATTKGDANRWYGTLTHGQAFADQAGFFNLHVSYHTSRPVEGRDRRYIANDLTYIDNPLAGQEGEYDFILGRRTPLYSSSYRTFLLDGRPYRLDSSAQPQPLLPDSADVFGSSTTQLAALSVDDTYGSFYSRYEWARLAVPLQKLNLSSNFNRELSANTTLTGELKYVRSNSESRLSPLVEFGVARLPVDYAFYTPEQQAAVSQSGQGLLFGGYFPEMGRMGSDLQYDLYQAVLAIEGYTSNQHRWQLSAQHGATRLQSTHLNSYREEHWRKGVWGSFRDPQSGEIRSCDSGCVPINVFQPLTEEAMNYLKLDPHQSSAKLQQSILAANLDGDLWQLPAGYISYAAGVEHRREQSRSTPSDVQLTGIGPSSMRSEPLIGKYHVSEAYAELRLPLLDGLPAAERLSLDTAWRTARYNLAGTNHSWSLGLDWMPFETLKVRASRAKAVRAPNINEIFQPQSQFRNYVFEVCYSAYRQLGSEYREANCDALGLTDPANYYWDALIVTTGNDQLRAERAYTFTGGLVYSPGFIDNLNLTVDYWDINLVDKIGTLPWGEVYPNCMDSSSLDNIFCQLIERRDNLMVLSLSYLNLARHQTRGIDYALDYHYPIQQLGLTLGFNSNWGRLIERKLQSDPVASVLETVGGMAFPKWRGRNRLSLSTQQSSLSLTAHYIGRQKPSISRDPSRYEVTETGRVWYLDLALSHRLTEQLSLSASAFNLTDRQTPQVPGASTGGASWEMGYTAGLYNTLGRYYSLGIHYSF
ncbi:TonB-dependent receptor [Alkalimonas sp.]|uniref:TonB-dependent receptor plug domain-containing protein n=1 Tax=Alkalimonas sp. TaxID=1872453 RepID=UPI00263A75B0|nr:TonB-dependent receptor [Alkalimonas sp.]MCC5827479.1 TonB-dependent receptor [Alkalimonas sp.]